MPVRKHYQHGPVTGIKVGRINAGINTNFIVYHFGDTLIDTGPANQWRFVKPFVQSKPIKRLLLTHHHEDHSGNAQRIADMLDLVPMAPELAHPKLDRGYKTPLLQRFIWGSPQPVKTSVLPEQLELDEYGLLQAVHTPGHARDLHCFVLAQQGWLFSGDLYIANKLKYLRIDEDLEQLMLSIKRILQFEFDVVFCPHKGIDEQGRQGLVEKLDFLYQLSASAQQAAKAGKEPAQVRDELVGPEDMMGRMTGYNLSKTNLINSALKVDLSLFD